MTPPDDRLVARLKEVKLLSGANALLGWDQETYMPPKAAEVRSEQLALIAGLIHDRVVAGEVSSLLAELEGSSLDPLRRACVREVRRSHDRERKLPKEVVEEIARTTSLAQDAWRRARKASDFSQFAPWLEKQLALAREVARRIGAPGQDPYDALLDDYEPGETCAELAKLFQTLEREVVPLVKKVLASPRKPRREVLSRRYPRDRQEELARLVARDMGFDFDAGRLDVSAHPFCTSLSPADVRLTTRYKEDDFGGALFGVMHEAGHGLYEQGLDEAHFGTPLAEACSMGVHESQSRLWENQVGRSRAFWKRWFPVARALFSSQLADVTEDDFVLAINDVRPSLIRVESDEVTYNLHILLRFEVERDLISGNLAVSDLPKRWNARMDALLGVVPATDAEGCLQDVHWSLGAFAYFPTYTCGNVYAAQLFARARKELDLDRRIAEGELRPLREWLREKVHRKGKALRPRELVAEATGKPASADDFVAYLRTKYGELYGV